MPPRPAPNGLLKGGRRHSGGMLMRTSPSVSPVAGWHAWSTSWTCLIVTESGHVAFGNVTADAVPAAHRKAVTARRRVSRRCMDGPLVAVGRNECWNSVRGRSGWPAGCASLRMGAGPHGTPGRFRIVGAARTGSWGTSPRFDRRHDNSLTAQVEEISRFQACFRLPATRPRVYSCGIFPGEGTQHSPDGDRSSTWSPPEGR